MVESSDEENQHFLVDEEVDVDRVVKGNPRFNKTEFGIQRPDSEAVLASEQEYMQEL